MCSEGSWGPTSSGWASGAGLGLVPAAPLVRVPHLLRCGRRAPAGEGRLGAELDSRSASHARQVVGTKCRHASFARSYGFSASRCVSRLFPAKSFSKAAVRLRPRQPAQYKGRVGFPATRAP